MKKKLTVNTLALGNLRHRKKQYASLIIGIILAMVFSSGILIAFSSIYASLNNMHADMFGNQDGIYTEATQEMFADAADKHVVGNYGFAHVLGAVKTTESDAFAVCRLDDEARALSNISFVEGGYPQAENEIAIEKATLAKLGLDASVGDTVTLEFYVQNGPSYLPGEQQKSYVLSGIAVNKLSNYMAHRDMSSDDLPSVFVSEDTRIEPGGMERLVCYFDYYGSGITAQTDGYERFYDYLGEELQYEYHFDTSGYYYNDLSAVSDSAYYGIILVFILLLASCLGIVNAFSSNLNERKKQIGMLRTVGATKRQIITIFGREALIISLLCAPVSVLLSCLSVRLVIFLLGDNYVFSANWYVILLCLVAGIACVMLAALIPLVKAAGVSPVQTVRNISATRKMARKKIKSRHTFSPPSLIAKRNMLFHGGSRAAASLILVAAIVVSCFGFSYVKYAQGNIYSLPHDYSLGQNSWSSISPFFNYKGQDTGFTESAVHAAEEIPYVGSVTATRNCKVLIRENEFSDYEKTILYGGWDGGVYTFDPFSELPPADIDGFMQNNFTEEYLTVKNSCAFEQEFYSVNLVALDSRVIERLEPFVSDGDINISRLDSGSEVIMIAPEKVAFGVDFDRDGTISSFGTTQNENVNHAEEYFDRVLKTAQCSFAADDALDISLLTSASNGNSATVSQDNMEITTDADAQEWTAVPPDWERSDKTMHIGAICPERPDLLSYEAGFGASGDIILLTTLSGMDHFYESKYYSDINIDLKDECTDEVDLEVTSTLQEIADTLPSGAVTSNFATVNDQKQFNNSFLLSMLALIILFISISASIINNSLTAQIREGRREIGTLRAVGASARELFGSYIRQLVSLLAISYAVGFAVFAVIYGGIHIASALDPDSTGPELILSLWQTVLACVLLFLFCVVNLWLKIKKEMKHSVIDNIREL